MSDVPDTPDLRARTLRSASPATARVCPFVVVILGPTAGGKSDLAMELARRIGGELVSADSMQVYRGMDIGTAKPTPAERAEIVHHAIDQVDASEDGFTVARWLDIADRAIADILARGRVPIVVGGTNLYIRAFLEGLDTAPAADASFREALESVDSAALHARLAALDPSTAARLHVQDRRRVVRALEIAHTTGELPSARRTAWDEVGVTPRRNDLFTVVLDWPVERINRRINARVKRMFEAGFVREVAELVQRGGLCAQARAACGYEELIKIVGDGTRTPRQHEIDEAMEQTKIRSRRLAKQQRTWLKRFRTLKPSVSIACDDTISATAMADTVEHALRASAHAHSPRAHA
ncbi:MAG: tRNA (adenosine(37)-N6)-dimethylallyltransferase MiaA [Limnohabitans sp.]|jgi:tRNA dimethylallyltransferase|nr:tRNA (adenosine(37)-N6)-dimethylallyltransferase MiaA [Limnohabitans sp.]